MQQQAPGSRALGSVHDPRPAAAVTIEGVEREQQILEAAHEAGFDLAGLAPFHAPPDLERYRAVTAEDVKAAAALLRADRRGLLRVRPETEEEPTAPEGGE